MFGERVSSVTINLSIIVFVSAFLAGGHALSQDSLVEREPAHAGLFYPADKYKLEQVLADFFKHVPKEPCCAPRAIIVPHAGYQFSGQTSAYAFSLLKDQNFIKRIILLAPSHYSNFNGLIINAKNYKTPLGAQLSDAEAIKKLKASSCRFKTNEVAETKEHADEVQIPFIQYVAPQAAIISIIVGDLTSRDLTRAAHALDSIVDDETVIVVSSDFTHYGDHFNYKPQFKNSIERGIADLNNKAIDAIVSGDLTAFEQHIAKTHDTICGKNPIRLLLKLFEIKKWPVKGRLLRYDMSGRITGDFTNSVSYAAIALGQRVDKKCEQQKQILSDKEQQTLLALSRHVLTTFVTDAQKEFSDAYLSSYELTQPLKELNGVFVTLRKNGQLRGCIGSILPQKSLYEGVIENTINAVAHDPRFQPVTTDELKDITIEISVLLPLKKISSLDEIIVGRDGLMLVNNNHSGVFLPQVPIEQQWNKKMFLEELGLKAHLSKQAYKDKSTQLYTFTAQVFSEN